MVPRQTLQPSEEAGMSTFSNPLTEYSPQLEFEDAGSKPAEKESGRGIFDEHDEMEHAIALLEVANEERLDRCLGILIQEANRKLGNAVSRQVGGAIAGVLKKSRATCCPLRVRRPDIGSAAASGRNSAAGWPPSGDLH